MKRLVLFSVLFTLAFGSTFGAALDGEAPVLVVAMLPGEYAAEAAELPDEDAGGAADEDACAICLTAFDALSIAELGQRTECCNPVAPHTFHLECALAWQERSGNLQCPTHDGAEFGPEVMEVGVTRAKASFWREVRDFIKHRENVRCLIVLGTDFAIQRVLKSLYLRAIDQDDYDAMRTYTRSSVATALGLTVYLIVFCVKAGSGRIVKLNFLKQKADHLFKHEIVSEIIRCTTIFAVSRGALELLGEQLGHLAGVVVLVENGLIENNKLLVRQMARQITDILFQPIINPDYLVDFCKQVIGVGMVFAVVVPTIHCGRSLVAAIRRTFKAIKTNSLKMVEPDFFDPHDLLS